MRIALKTGQPFYGVIRNRRMDNTHFPNLLHMTTFQVQGVRYVLGLQVDVTGMVVTTANVSEEMQAELNGVLAMLTAANIQAWIVIQAALYNAKQATILRNVVAP